MAAKDADMHTLAPRLSYVEDLTEWLKDNRGGGEGGADPSALLQKLYLQALGGADGGAMSDTPWTEDLIYGTDIETSLHVTLFGIDASTAVSCQDGRGFHGKIFAAADPSWDLSETDRPLTHDIGFGVGINDSILARLREISSNLVKSVWDDDASMIGYSGEGTIIGRILRMREDLDTVIEDLDTAIEAERDSRISAIDDINGQLDSIRSRLAAGGL